MDVVEPSLSILGPSPQVFLMLVVMFVAGVAGGIAGHLLGDSETISDQNDKLGILKSAFVGVIAAFVVPLFLTMASSSVASDLIDGINISYNSFLLGGFCLIALEGFV